MYSLFFPINSSLTLVLTNCCMISLIAQIVYVGAERLFLLQLKHSARSRDSSANLCDNIALPHAFLDFCS